ncbi:hybrid sensor histidine kinase/response regulator [Roseibium sp. Sym1]|uniref:hybrid sensor histidine kinase/response regulator n=1 Tax=Roseibium sp. Sym1 TaxID=3016006 RepID=UPI0022B5D81C|nr:hybrid sensor histidine kinase/response regulator [Roseibium sp. Sym1]
MSEVEKLKRINAALMERVERSMDQQGSSFSLFQTAIGLEKQVRQKTDELAFALRRLEHTNQELNTAKEAAEQANISKTRFLAAASHDILQPLNAASLSISTLADLQTTGEGRALAAQVENALATMDELLKTLLDISKLDSGVMVPEVRPLPLADMLNGLRDDFEAFAAERRLRIRFRFSRHQVLSDRTMLRRILQNIISNAVNYTPTGGVLVGTRKRGDRLRIDVVDTGIGISEEGLRHVFEEFYRGRQPKSVQKNICGGLGLGLSIVQRMATALGHELTVSSSSGKGSRFSLYVPLAEAGTAEQTGPAPAALRLPANTLAGARVLLLENDPAGIQAMESLLWRWQCSVRIASQRQEVDEILADETWRPDVVLADQHLDNGDLGTEIVEAVLTGPEQSMPVIFITADPDDDLTHKAGELNAELMYKPVKPAELRSLMASLLSPRRTGPAPPPV